MWESWCRWSPVSAVRLRRWPGSCCYRTTWWADGGGDVCCVQTPLDDSDPCLEKGTEQSACFSTLWTRRQAVVCCSENYFCFFSCSLLLVSQPLSLSQSEKENYTVWYQLFETEQKISTCGETLIEFANSLYSNESKMYHLVSKQLKIIISKFALNHSP